MAAIHNPNLAILELVAHALGPVCDSVVFVGGCATGLLLTQERPDRIRITEDVDIVAQALTTQDYSFDPFKAGVMTLDLTGIVVTGLNSFAIADSGSPASFSSREAGMANGPRLVITY